MVLIFMATGHAFFRFGSIIDLGLESIESMARSFVT